MLVRHIMCTEIFSLPPDTSVLDALLALKTRRIRRAPLLDEKGALVGFITERDLLKATPGSVAELNSSSGAAAVERSVGQLASEAIISAHPDDHVEDLAGVFLRERIGGVPVVDRGKVVGVVTESDIFRTLAGAAEQADAMRITVQRSQAEVVKSVHKVVHFLRLELVGLTQYPGADDRDVFVLKVRGERINDLGPELTRSGWLVLDRREPSEPSRRAAG